MMAGPLARLGNLSLATIDAGAAHVCGLHHDGAIYCWGSNDAGQLNAPAGTSWMHVSAGEGHSCALDTDGNAACWGDNSFGQSAPPEDTRFSTLSAGELHTCGLRLDGTAECWGSDIDGQATPPDGMVLTQLSSGAHHTCALAATGEPSCWGLDAYGQATPPPALARFARLFTDWSGRGPGLVTCGLHDNGLTQCWGEGWNPSLPVQEGARFAEIATAREIACGLLLDGRASCWHYYPDSADSDTNAVVAGVPSDLRFTELVIVGHRACGLTGERYVRCWGPHQNSDGRDLPIPPTGEQVAIAANNSHACALSHAGFIECWSGSTELPRDLGRLSLSQRDTTSIGEHFDIGDATKAVYRSLTLGNAARRGPEGWERVRVHGCALHQHQSVTCWGANEFGQASPPSGVRFSSVSAGSRHTCGITAQGHARCWGADDVGQSTPPAGEVFSELHAERDSTCGLRTTGDVVCWGDYGLSTPAQLVPFVVNLPEQHFTDIMALDRLGFFDGTECSTQRLCADAPLTRATMAVWLDRLLLHEAPSAAPESAASIEFDDVLAEPWWAIHAQRLTALKVMTPCDTVARLLCPDDHVSRAELERALVRAVEIRLTENPQTAANVAVASARVAVGTDVESTCIEREPRACRQTAVTRGQAATVLNRFREHIERLALPGFTSISANHNGGCGRRADGTVECWGQDGSGEAYVATDDRVLDVFYDGYFWCGRTVSREPRCHGWDGYKYSHAREALDIASRTEIAFGSVYACGVERDGAVTCVGGVPSDGSDEPYEVASPSIPLTYEYQQPILGLRFASTLVPQAGRFSHVAVGFLHRCALQTDGAPMCWGKNEFGEAVPPANERFLQLALGVSHSCGLRLDGSVECWGYDIDGRSSPPSTRLVTPAAVTGPAAGALGVVRSSPIRIKTIAAASAATCGLTLDGLVACWGTSRSQGSSVEQEDWWNAYEPTVGPPADIEGQVFTSITATDGYFCAERLDGRYRCWGSHPFRRSLDAEAAFVEVSVNDDFTCGRRSDRTVQCWTYARRGRAPTGSFETITTANTYACGRTVDGLQSCWTLHPDRQVPVEVATGDFAQLSDSGYHTCALGTDGAIACWGRNDTGEATPPPEGLFARVSAGAIPSYATSEVGYYAHTCGVRVNGTLECWGDNSLGQSAPPPGDDFVTVAASGVHACGLRRNGDIECWGQKLRIGGPLRATEQYSDVVVGAGGGFDYEDGDGSIWHSKHVCGLRIDGIVDCWGNWYSPNKPYNRNEPDSRSRFTSISSGDSHVCGVRTDGAIECWGQPAFIAY